MHICLATSTFPAGPEDSAHAFFLVDVVRTLERHGHRVSVLTQARESHPRPPLPGLDVVWFPWRKLGNRLAELSFGSVEGVVSATSLAVNGVRAVREMRRSRGIDVFLCAWVIPSGFYLLLDHVLAGSRTPYALWALGSDVNKYGANPVARGVLRRIAGRAAAVYADGYGLCRDVTAVTGRDCDFLPTFRAVGPARPPRAAHAPRRFLYVGRHAKVKGVDVLVDALVRSSGLGGVPFEFQIAGDGDLTPELARRIRVAGLSDRVRFSGRLSDEALVQAYEESDCVVIPSRSESIPLVLSEALRAGLPLIVTDVGDMGDLVRRHDLGAVVEKEDPVGLAAALRRFVESPHVLREESYRSLLDELTFEAAAPRLLARLEGAVRA